MMMGGSGSDRSPKRGDGEWVGTPVLDQAGRQIGRVVGWEATGATTITRIELDDDVSLDHPPISVGYTLASDEDGDGDGPPHVTPEILAAYDAAGPGPENLGAYTAWHETVRQVLKALATMPRDGGGS